MKVSILKQRKVTLTDEDWADLETIRAALGQRSQSAAIRKLIENWKKGKKK